MACDTALISWPSENGGLVSNELSFSVAAGETVNVTVGLFLSSVPVNTTITFVQRQGTTNTTLATCATSGVGSGQATSVSLQSPASGTTTIVADEPTTLFFFAQSTIPLSTTGLLFVQQLG